MITPIQNLGGPRLSDQLKAERPCQFCGAPVLTYEAIPAVTCKGDACQAALKAADRAAQMAEHQARMDETVTKALRRCGMGPGELGATREGCTRELLALCLPYVRDLLNHPETPSGGFGLYGGNGIGKTGLIAWITREWTRRSAHACLAAYGVLDLRCWRPVWANWESKLAELHGAFGDGWRLADLMDEMKETPLLVLEDLGAEQGKADRDASWSNQQLYEILEARFSAQRATLWTTNLKATDLIIRYSPRIFSRLNGLAPLIEAPAGLPDRRMLQSRGRVLAMAGSRPA